jgi:MFS family permease
MAFVLLMLLALAGWLLPCMLIAHWADKWGHRGWIWLLVALFFSPVLAALLVLVRGKNKNAPAQTA